MLHLCVDYCQHTDVLACNIEKCHGPDRSAMQCTRIDPPRWAFLDIAGNMGVAGE